MLYSIQIAGKGKRLFLVEDGIFGWLCARWEGAFAKRLHVALLSEYVTLKSWMPSAVHSLEGVAKAPSHRAEPRQASAIERKKTINYPSTTLFGGAACVVYTMKVRRLMGMILAVGLSLAGISMALAEGIATKENSENSQGKDYDGVVPESEDIPGHVAKAGGVPVKVTWPGFQQRADGSSRLFVQFTSSADTQLLPNKDGFVLVIRNARIHGRNTRRKLDTRFFNTPMVEAKLKAVKNDVHLVVLERKPVKPTLSTAFGPKGYFYVYMDFPASELPTKTKATNSESQRHK